MITSLAVRRSNPCEYGYKYEYEYEYGYEYKYGYGYGDKDGIAIDIAERVPEPYLDNKRRHQ